ncbi:MAG: 16S rRNA (cytidine(1402)-2'-O)-methyltransferase [Rickettsiales bacterium]|jgi:16S rRNA (cytidine1402-2'-O)-methyltransferase|nr:16S rRNA (cytidine(1402)-2'-O)-methyltransferase [Rickettsiales bacterium]
MQSGLYLVGTPIGNLGDMSARAIETLRDVDLIACEDTRVFGKLASHFDIKTRRVAFHDHNEQKSVDKIMEMLRDKNMSVAVVSDAGMPGIADPGFRIVRACRDAGIPVFAVPGPTAVATAVAISGFATNRFTFCNFLPPTKNARLAKLRNDNRLRHTLVYYESPNRIMDTIADFAAIMPERKIAIIREITKIYEQAIIGYPAELVGIEPPRGEIVIVVEGGAEPNMTDEELKALVNDVVAAGHKTKDAAEIIASHAGISRSDAYEMVLKK